MVFSAMKLFIKVIDFRFHRRKSRDAIISFITILMSVGYNVHFIRKAISRLSRPRYLISDRPFYSTFRYSWTDSQSNYDCNMDPLPSVGKRRG